MTHPQTDERSHMLFLAWKLAIEHQGYVCIEASDIADRDLLYDGLTPDQPAQVIGTPWDDNGETVIVEINRRGLEEIVTYAPKQLVFVKRAVPTTGCEFHGCSNQALNRIMFHSGMSGKFCGSHTAMYVEQGVTDTVQSLVSEGKS